MLKPWPEITAFYRDLADRGLEVVGMVRLAEQIEASRYAAGIVGQTSMHDLCVMQTAAAFPDGPYLRISPRFDGTVEFRYIDTHIVERQWHRIVHEGDSFASWSDFLTNSTGLPEALASSPSN